jgi:hypothetical protein
LALPVPEIYTSRSAFSVTLAQALLFGGVCLVVDSFFSRRRGACGLPTAVVTSTAPGEVGMVIGGIERAARHPVLLATKSARLTPYGASPCEIVNLSTQQDAHLLTRPPTSTWPVQYTLWMSQLGGTVLGS